MGIIAIIFYIFFVLSAILLILLVLIQDEQGEGLGGIFGGGSSTPFGSRSGNILTRSTSIIGAVFLFCTLSLAWINRTPDDNVLEAARIRAGGEKQVYEWWNETVEPESSDRDGTEESAGSTIGTPAD